MNLTIAVTGAVLVAGSVGYAAGRAHTHHLADGHRRRADALAHHQHCVHAAMRRLVDELAGRMTTHEMADLLADEEATP